MSDLEDGIDTLQETETILTESHDAVKADIGKNYLMYTFNFLSLTRKVCRGIVE